MFCYISGDGVAEDGAAGAARAASDSAGGGSASSDIERSSSVSGGDAAEGEVSGATGDEDADASNSDEGGNGGNGGRATVGGSLFIKRSVDEDFANNNDSRNHGGDGNNPANEPDSERRVEGDKEEGMEVENEDDDDDKESGDKVEFPSVMNRNIAVPPSALTSLLALSGGSNANNDDEEDDGRAATDGVANQLKEQLKTISLTIQQLTANMTSGATKNVQELAVLQATLFSLQQQQLLQMQILSQLQQNSGKNKEKADDEIRMMKTTAARMNVMLLQLLQLAASPSCRKRWRNRTAWFPRVPLRTDH